MLELAVYGILLGSIIALGAIGLTLIYGILRFANFAHGELMTMGAYVVLFLVTDFFAWMGVPDTTLGPFSFGYRMLLSFPLGMLFVASLAVFLNKILFSPLRSKNSGPVILAMSALGVSFILRSIIFIIWGADFHYYNPGKLRPAIALPLGINIRPDQILILLIAFGLVFSLHIFLSRTKMGKAMRATSDNIELAWITGIDTDRVILWTWCIGGALAAAGGILYGIDVQLRPGMGWHFILPLFAATILGGIGNVYGALIGGMVIGIVQQLSTAIPYVQPTYKPAVAFIIMIVILLFRPQGIFGQAKK